MISKTSCTKFWLAWGALFIAGAAVGLGKVTVQDSRGTNGAGVVVMENSALKVTVNPALGGRITGFLWKPSGADWVLPDGETGFLMDHVWQQAWPGELLRRPYEVTILKSGPDSAQVQASVAIVGKGDKNIEGVKLIRTLTLQGASPRLDVTIRLENPTDQPRSPGFWVQNVIKVGGVREGAWTWRPTTRGVIGAQMDLKVGHCVPENTEFAYDPTAGWSAETYPEKLEGVVFLMDYNWLRCLYNCGGSESVEWWYDQVRLLPGKSFETRFTIWPFQGLKAVAYAESAFVAALQMDDSGTDLALLNQLVAGPDALADPVKVRLELLDYDTGQVLHSADFEKVAITAKVAEQKTALPKPPASKNLLARATVITADGKPHVYETYRAGGAVMGTERKYQTKRPLRVRPNNRPATIVKTPHDGTRILHLRGVFHEAYRLPETAKVMNAELKSGSYGIFVYGPTLSYFPGNYAELMGFDVIVLNNVPIEALDEQSTQYLADYVEHGGVLLVIGGHWAFGGGDYKDSKLEELLPVKTKGPFDVTPIQKGTLDPQPEKAAKVGACWLQDVTPRAEAEVLVKAGGKPFWIQWKKGKGRIVVLAGLAYGESSGQLLLFNEWEGWPKWLADKLKQAIQETGNTGDKK